MSVPLNEALPDHGKPRSDNLPEGMEVLPVLPEIIADEAVAPPALAENEEPPAYDAHKREALKQNVMAFAEACGVWRDLTAIQNAAQAARLTDFIAGARGLAKKVEDARKTDKAVWDAKAKEVQKAYEPLADVLDRILTLMKGMSGDWLKREEERINLERAERIRAADAAARQAEADAARAALSNDVVGEAEAAESAKRAEEARKAAERTAKASMGSASGAGRTIALRTVVSARITNQNAVYMHFREHPKVQEVLQSLANEAARAGTPAPGSERVENKVSA